jgi:hypothetical protein
MLRLQRGILTLAVVCVALAAILVVCHPKSQVAGDTISLKELYWRVWDREQDVHRWSNFFITSDGTVIFFQPRLRPELASVLNSEKANFENLFQVVSPVAKTSTIEKLLVRKTGRTLQFGSHLALESEIERQRLSPGWETVRAFCDNNGKSPDKKESLQNASIIRLANGQFLISGGEVYSRDAGFGPVKHTAIVFDSKSNAIVRSIPLCGVRRHHLSLQLPSGKVLLAGGALSFAGRPATFELVDVEAGTSRTLNCRPQQYRTYGTGCVDSRGRCLILGGMDANTGKEIAAVERIDVESDTIRTVANLKFTRVYDVHNDGVPENAVMLTADTLLVSSGTFKDPKGFSECLASLRENAELVSSAP